MPCKFRACSRDDLELDVLKSLSRSLIYALPQGVFGRLAPEMQGRLEFIRGYHADFYPYGGPMNGQAHRMEIARTIIERCAIERIVETGTYRGTTTDWFAQFGLPVDTVEMNRRFHAFARMRLRDHPNVSVHLGESVEFLTGLAAGASAGSATFFYLDAHWNDVLPLGNEIRIILDGIRHSVVMIDDFAVPGDSGYSYDNYGAGKTLTLGYLAEAAGRELRTFWPSASSRWETGRKRGCVVIAGDDDMAGILSRLPCLCAKRQS